MKWEKSCGWIGTTDDTHSRFQFVSSVLLHFRLILYIIYHVLFIYFLSYCRKCGVRWWRCGARSHTEIDFFYLLYQWQLHLYSVDTNIYIYFKSICSQCHVFKFMHTKKKIKAKDIFSPHDCDDDEIYSIYEIHIMPFTYTVDELNGKRNLNETGKNETRTRIQNARGLVQRLRQPVWYFNGGYSAVTKHSWFWRFNCTLFVPIRQRVYAKNVRQVVCSFVLLHQHIRVSITQLKTI